MKKIETFDELITLKLNDRFYFVSGCHHCMYIFVGVNPAWGKSIIAIPSYNHLTAKVFSGTDFNNQNAFLIGKYNSKDIGNVMVKYLENEIETISQIYLKEDSI